MECPFPGMDPYLERPALWPDFHNSLISAIRGILQPLLGPRYAAVTQDRLYVVESDRPMIPDVSIVQSAGLPASNRSATALADCDAPAIFRLTREEVREPYLEIIETAADERVVTTIEVLSPSNKVYDGRERYLEKREETWAGGINLVEIDLLRSGEPTIRVSNERLASLGDWKYIISVSRVKPHQEEVYAVPLALKLPNFRVPVASGDDDVPLDLQASFARAWTEGAYPRLLRYHQPPSGPLTDDELAWCRQILVDAGHIQG